MYVPPPAHLIDAFAAEACSILGANEPEVAASFAGFLKAVAQAQVNNLNRQNSNEQNRSEPAHHHEENDNPDSTLVDNPLN